MNCAADRTGIVMNIIRLLVRLIGAVLITGFVLIPPRLLINARNGITPWGSAAPLNMDTDQGVRKLIAVYDPQQRPYTPTSPWNTPIAQNPIYDTFSGQR